jgi:hypothetical protein
MIHSQVNVVKKLIDGELLAQHQRAYIQLYLRRVMYGVPVCACIDMLEHLQSGFERTTESIEGDLIRRWVIDPCRKSAPDQNRNQLPPCNLWFQF